MSQERLPNLEHCQPPQSNTNRLQHRKLSNTADLSSILGVHEELLNRLKNRERERELQRRQRLGTTGLRRYQLNPNAPPFFPQGSLDAPPPIDNYAGASVAGSVMESSFDASRQSLGERLYPKIRLIRGANLCPQITGMLLQLPSHQIVTLLGDDEALRVYVEEAVDLLLHNV